MRVQVGGCPLCHTHAVGEGFIGQVTEVHGISVPFHLFIIVEMEHHGYRFLALTVTVLQSHDTAVGAEYMPDFHRGVGKLVMPVA